MFSLWSVILLSLLSVHSASVNVLTVVCDFNLFAVSA